jgi:hypothetical protein
MTREGAHNFFKCWEKSTSIENSLLNKPQYESCIQLINEPGKIASKKWAKVACCQADGEFVPSSLILKGVNEKQELGGGGGRLNGSNVYMKTK